VNGEKPPGEKGRLPMDRVSWKAAFEWCEAAGLRLPNEAEWEYACRAGSAARFCFGDEYALLDRYGWYFENSENTAHPVGEKLPNAFGLFDMHGNIREWCMDRWSESYEGAPTDGSARVSGNDSFRVHRGGGFINDAEVAQSAWRDKDPPIQKWYRRGFRPAVSIQ
jgi:formylglycine-generating enzyme required for sulfatase activity